MSAFIAKVPLKLSTEYGLNAAGNIAGEYDTVVKQKAFSFPCLSTGAINSQEGVQYFIDCLNNIIGAQNDSYSSKVTAEYVAEVE